MSKLYFRYGAMNCGKTTTLLQVDYNYKERGMNSIILKPSIDQKGDRKIVSRIGMTKEVDYLITPDENIRKTINLNNIDCILVDEAQFLSRDQVTQLWEITKEEKIPVICYGLKTDFKTNGFPGSIRLFELADQLEELITICHCGKKARFNGRKINNQFVFDGEQVAIDGIDATYESLCGECYLKYQKNEINTKKNDEI